MSKILLTGFGLFGANPYNPTKDVAEYIGSKKKFADSKIEIAILPVTFGTAAEILLRYASKEKVRAVISLGLSGAARSKNAEIYLETKAKNIMNAKNRLYILIDDSIKAYH